MDSDYSDHNTNTLNNMVEHSPEIHIANTNKNRRRATHHDGCAVGTTTVGAETLVRRAVTEKRCELFHALNKEMFIRTVSHFTLVKQNGKYPIICC